MADTSSGVPDLQKNGSASEEPLASELLQKPNKQPLKSPWTEKEASCATTVHSFDPIPGARQHKRPSCRLYHEIERMYKCGWNGCEKAYSTLNHLNAHVTRESHGAKRTPEESKEIRKEWKARKKEEVSQRKAAKERKRAAAAQADKETTDHLG